MKCFEFLTNGPILILSRDFELCSKLAKLVASKKVTTETFGKVCSTILYLTEINTIKVQAHSKQKDLSLKSASVKSLKCDFNSDFEPVQ